MAHDLSGPPAGQSPGENPDVAGLSAADPVGAGQPPGAVEAPTRPPWPRARCLGEARKAPEAALPHASRLLGCAPCRVPVFYAVAASPRRYRAGSDLGYHRGHRLRAGSARGVDLASLRRPGSPASAAPVLARVPHLRSRPYRGLVRPRAVLAVRDPRADGGYGLQHPAGHRVAIRGGGGVLPLPADRARPSRPVPLGREPARPLDRAARGARGRLDPGGRPRLPGGQRPAAARLRQPHEQRVLAARHHDRRGDAPAHDRPALRGTGLGHSVGHAGLAGPQLHRQGP